MPIVEPNQSKRVLVTGANGYIALWVVKILLEQGYRVRGAVRSEEKGKKLLDTFKSYGSEQLEYAVVKDITQDGAFDEAVRDMDAIAHTASPLSAVSEDPDELIQPALRGTLGVLNSALKNGPNIKRIVITSSCAALLHNVTAPTEVFDENNWADEAIGIVKEQGRKALFMEKYRTSKALAERAAWDFTEKHKSEIGWDLVTIQPPFVIGPPLQEVKAPSELNVSLDTFFKNMCTERPEDVLKGSYGYVHVEDVAKAHVDSLKTEAAGGQRLIISSGATTWQNTRNLLKELYPKLYAAGALPIGYPQLPEVILWRYDAAKSERILGIKYKTIKEIAKDTMDDFIARGWIKEAQFNN
ncbi:hypothetical protein D9613_001222 [Agrocybe pediades]|uniref:NAD-dependent epimerase/dehydratase domain-containing protein n=1 Tax=Agrocybe pediades TaxID=84607 RepID=A0A8H4R163_9AGAR|nr:hypothetical protein D9613_001222 [Agrocybe pediades]